MKKPQIPRLKKEERITQILNILPALQSDIWKKLGIERRHCSRLMKEMEDNSLIKKTKIKGGTYMVEKINVINKFDNATKYSALLSGSGKFSPCCRCETDCNSGACQQINRWLLEVES